MDVGAPKFRRRKADRPAEIVQAALAVFAEKGFAAAKLEDIARRAGVSKGALYLYFETKEDIFRAVVGQGIAPNVGAVQAMAAAHPGPLADLLRGVTAHLATVVSHTPLGGVLKMVVGESGNFPEIARVWHDELVSPALGAMATAIQAAQARGEVKPGDPRIYALQLISPLLVSILHRETFVPVGAEPFDIPAVIAQHIDTLLCGLLTEGARA
ncbi:MAG: TetR/AcrR family transcriptional regulator [Alphaproteobacteria bacterium]|nr:TetR/AcrR family transcriptional regulator [Alphaproteobacteria bacterium]MBU1516131.1 TetR/AcrR family transcriptional regulator [Alphaproteobacteria bacterium]MBU2092654.1 TetR/AcrR family transcriptional regulator [Alphaproteobacteria bacterium]MBU2150104.1 TetR/AcrR family transcriptional regulator [Alphaproteobacteria bacterium]MBU2308449.1 TetR/AcrR family transcriptional regulator [Alphaproteobacteria bacterium]